MDTDAPNHGDDADIVDQYGCEDYDESDTEVGMLGEIFLASNELKIHRSVIRLHHEGFSLQ